MWAHVAHAPPYGPMWACYQGHGFLFHMNLKLLFTDIVCSNRPIFPKYHALTLALKYSLYLCTGLGQSSTKMMGQNKWNKQAWDRHPLVCIPAPLFNVAEGERVLRLQHWYGERGVPCTFVEDCRKPVQRYRNYQIWFYGVLKRGRCCFIFQVKVKD